MHEQISVLASAAASGVVADCDQLNTSRFTRTYRRVASPSRTRWSHSTKHGHLHTTHQKTSLSLFFDSRCLKVSRIVKTLEPPAVINVIVQQSLRNVKLKVPSNWITGNYFLFLCLGLVVEKTNYSQTSVSNMTDSENWGGGQRALCPHRLISLMMDRDMRRNNNFVEHQRDQILGQVTIIN